MEENEILGFMELITQECTPLKKLEGKVLENFKNMFGFEDDIEGVYYNEYNLAFTNREAFDSIKYLVPQHELLISVEMPEFNEHFYVIRYFQDTILNELLV